MCNYSQSAQNQPFYTNSTETVLMIISWSWHISGLSVHQIDPSVFPCRHAVTGISQRWRQCHHEELQLQMGLLPGLSGGGLLHLLLPAPGVVWEELPRAVRSSGKSHSGVGEARKLEEGGICSHQPAPPSPCRCFTLFHMGPLQIIPFSMNGVTKRGFNLY